MRLGENITEENMSAKILVADDSLTIQKVVGITLADTGYELEQCKSENDLYEKIKVRRYDLILLDFNLSDSKNGYDLAKEVLSISPDVKVLVMLGTFDSVDESQLGSIGVADKIVKPFESAKFVEKCSELINQVVHIESNDESESDNETDSEHEEKTEEISLGHADEEEQELENDNEDDIDIEETSFEEIRVESIAEDDENSDEKTEEILLSNKESFDSSEDDTETSDESVLEEGADFFKQEVDEDLINDSNDWVVDSPSQEDESLLESSGGLWEEDEKPVTEDTTALNTEVESWGMSVPGVIGGSPEDSLFPPVIEENATSKVVSVESISEDLSASETSEDTQEVQIQDTITEISRDGEEVRLPGGDDLDYPEMGDVSEEASPGPKSKLVSLDDLTPNEEDEDEELDATDPLIESPSSDQLNIVDEIESEVSPDEFWAVDNKSDNDELSINEFVEGAGANPDMVDLSDSTVESSDDDTSDQPKEKSSESHSHEEVLEVEIDKDEILASITESLRPAIEEMVRELCRDKVEQIAWEVIPDLAKILSRKRLEKFQTQLTDK